MKHTLLSNKFIGYAKDTYEFFSFYENPSASIFQIKDFSKKIAVDIASLGLMTGTVTINQETTLRTGYFMAITDMNGRVIKYEEYTPDRYSNTTVDYFVTTSNGSVNININKIRQVFGGNIKIMLSTSSTPQLNLTDNNGVNSTLLSNTSISTNKLIGGIDANHNVRLDDNTGFNVYTITLPWPTYGDFFYITLDKNMKSMGTVDDPLAIFHELFTINNKYIEFSETEIVIDLPTIKTNFGDQADTFNIQIPNTPTDVIIEQVDYDENPRLIFPPVLPGIIGRSQRLYYKNAKYELGTKFDIMVPGTQIIGGAMVYLPSNGWNMNIYKFYRGKKEVFSMLNKGISTDTTPSITNAKVMLLGESTTDNIEFRSHVQKLITEDTKLGAVLIGSRGAGTADDPKHEGYPGWDTNQILGTQNFNGITNAFYNPATQGFDLDYYFSSTGVSVPDVVYIAFGINDIASSRNEDRISIIKNIQKIMDAFYDKNNNIKFILGLSNLPSEWEQFESASQYEASRGMLRSIERMIAIYGYSKRVTLAPLYLSLHRKWHMIYEQEPVVEFSDVQEYYGTNNVHPSSIGFDMTGEMAYNSLRLALSN